MKLLIGLTLSLTLAAGSAAAQGTFNNGRKPSTGFGTPSSNPPSSYGAPAYGSAADDATSPSRYKPKIYGAPEAPKAQGFEPYKPYTGGSVYSSPSTSGGASGAKDCERSVYTNACAKRR